MIPILIADDHGVLRAGLRALLNSEPGFRVVGEAADGHEALSLAELLHPDVVLADINMPGPSGIQVARELKQRQPGARVVILTMHEDPTLLEEAMRAGASGYVVKRAVETDLVDAIRTVARGDVYIDPGLRYAFSTERTRSPIPDGESAEPLAEGESELLRLMARAYTTQQLADALGVSTAEVETRRTDLMTRLGLRSRIDVMRYARQHCLLGD